MKSLLDRVLPETWADDLAAGLGKEFAAQVASAAKVRAPAASRKAFEADVREVFGEPEALRERVARKLARAGSDAEAKQAAAAFVARELERLVDRATRTLMPEHVERFLGEAALHDEAKRLHRVVERWMPTDGPEGVQEWLDLDTCSLGTALSIYWRVAPHWYRQWAKRSDVPKPSPWERKFFAILKEIERRVARSEFPHAGISFDPTAAGKAKHDLTIDDYAEFPRLWEIPEAIYVRTTRDGLEPVPRKPARRRRRRSS